LLLLLPVIGLAFAAPPVIVVFSLPLFLALLLRCLSLEIPLVQWQARSMETEHVVLKPIAVLLLSGRIAEVRRLVGYFYVVGRPN
jgi:hypothetical protein